MVLAGVPVASAFMAPTTAFHGASSGLGRQGGVQERVNANQGVCQMVAGGRVPFIAGNWKMNPLDLDSAKALAKQVCTRYASCIERQHCVEHRFRQHRPLQCLVFSCESSTLLLSPLS